MSDINLIPFAKPIISSEEKSAIAEVLEQHVLTHGPRCTAFERKFADFKDQNNLRAYQQQLKIRTYQHEQKKRLFQLEYPKDIKRELKKRMLS